MQGRALTPAAVREAGGDHRSDLRGSVYARAAQASWTIGRSRLALVAAHLALAGLLAITALMRLHDDRRAEGGGHTEGAGPEPLTVAAFTLTYAAKMQVHPVANLLRQ